MTDKPVREIQISVALVIRDGCLLLLERRDDNPTWDHKWEFPGGKIEDGERSVDTVVRELREETGLTAISQKFLGVHTHDWKLPERILRVHLHCFRCEVHPDPISLEARTAYSYAWVRPEDALSYDCLEANEHLIRTYLLQPCDDASNLGRN